MIDDEELKETSGQGASDEGTAPEEFIPDYDFSESSENAEEQQDEKTEDKETDAEDSSDAEETVEASKLADLEKRYMNLFAEYENYRKRSVREKENLYSDAVADVTSKWLPILDNIDRAAVAGEGADEQSVEKVLQGIDMMSKQAADILSKIGVEEIAAARGDIFDPNMHEAVMHIEDAELGEQQIAAVFQKGYKYKDRVIRHAVVQVAN